MLFQAALAARGRAGSSGAGWLALQGHHFAHQAREVLAGGFQRAFHHRALELFAAQRGVELLDRLLGGSPLGGQRRFQRADALVERGVGVLGAGQRGFLGGEGAGQRALRSI